MAGDKTYIEDSSGNQHRATRTKAVTPESIVWSGNPNDYTVQVRIDGKWHRAILTYDMKDATFFDNINIDKALVTGGDGKTHTALIVSPEASDVVMSSIPTDEHSIIEGTTTGETVVNTYSENWSNVVWQDNVNVYKVLVEGSDGKKHTALLTTNGGGGAVEIIVKGISPISLPDAIADSLEYLKAFGGTELVAETYLDTATADGKCEQADVPTPDDPVDIVCNNGVLKWDSVNQTIYADGTVETVTDAQSNTATCEKLLSVGDYKDTQEILSGAITHNVGVKVFDGTENWASDPVGTGGYIRFNYSWSAPLKKPGFDVLANIFATQSGVVGPNATNAVISGHGTNTNIYLAFPANLLDGDLTTTAGRRTAFNNWLSAQYNAGTPFILLYALETPTTETVTGQSLTKEPLTVTGSLNNLVVNAVSTSHTVPTPTQPLDIVSNNGVLKLSPNLLDKNLVPDVNEYINRSTGSLSTPTIGEFRHSDYIEIKKGTQYYVGIINSAASSAGLAFYDDTKTYLSGISLTQLASDNNIITSPNYTKYIRFSFRTDEGYNTDWENTVYLVEGNQPLSEFLPYGIYADGTVETIRVHGKNFFNKDDSTNWGGWYPANGVIAQSTNANRTVAMRCQPNTTYYFKHCTYTGGLRAFCIETETWDLGTPVASTGGAARDDANVVYSFTTTANAKWLFALFGRNDAVVTTTFEEQASDYMLSTEVLTSDTPYEPYYNGGTATAEMLLKVDDYQDVQSIIDGTVTRNVGVKVLDGTENWNTGSAQNPNRFILAGAFNDIAQIPNENVGYSNCYTVIARSSNIQSILQNNECGWNTTQVFCVRDDRFTTVAQFTAWLADQYNAGTPVIVLYPLATPTTESVTGQPMQVQQGDNFVEITQASLDNLELEAKYQAAVSLTIQEVQDANLDPNVQVTIN